MTLLRKLFLILFSVIVIPTMVLMSITYVQTKNFIENEAVISNHQIVKQAKVATDSIISQTERITSQIAIDSATQRIFSEELDTTDYDQYVVLDEVFRILLNFKEGTQYIDDIAVYVMESDLLISTINTEQPSVATKTPEYLIEMAEESPMKLWIEPYASGVFWEQRSEFHFVRFIYTNGDELAGFISVRLRNTDFDRIINEMYIKDDGMIFIADQTGKLILGSTDEYRNIVDLTLDFEWFNNDENYRNVTLDGTNYFLSFVSSEYNNWKYISIIDKREIESKLGAMRNSTLFLLLFFTVVSVGLSYAVSQGIYNPIQLIKSSLEGEMKKKTRNNFLLGQNEFLSINKDITTLMDELRANKIIRSDYETTVKKVHKYEFYRLIKGDQLESTALQDMLTAEKSDAPCFRLLIVEFFKKLTANQEDAIKDFLDSVGLIESFFESDSQMVAILKSDKLVISEEELIGMLKSFCTELQDLPEAVVALGEAIRHDQIKSGYERLLKILKYSLIKNQKGLVVESQYGANTQYKRLPYDYATYLNNSLRASSMEETRTIVLELTKVIKSDFYYASNYSFYFKDVLNTIIGFLYEIQYIKSEDLLEVSASFSDFDVRFSDIDEAAQWTLRFIDNIFNFISGKERIEEDNIVNRSIRIIETGYMNDISLAEVAERINVSAPYLSRQFKDQTGINFKDYVTNCKIEKAKQLLLGTDQTVESIANDVGYNSSLQLVRMFKKLESITPTEYRKRH